MSDLVAKVFIWRKWHGSHCKPTKGPYWTSPHWQIYGRKTYWTLGELLNLPFSNTIKNRLKGLRVGTELQVYSTGRNSYESITRLSNEQILLINESKELQESLNQVKSEIKTAIPELIEREKQIKKEIAKHKKQMDKAGVI